jgi:hypothetical protein
MYLEEGKKKRRCDSLGEVYLEGVVGRRGAGEGVFLRSAEGGGVLYGEKKRGRVSKATLGCLFPALVPPPPPVFFTPHSPPRPVLS